MRILPNGQLPPCRIRPKHTKSKEDSNRERLANKRPNKGRISQMKTIRISEEIHRKLTATLGTLMAETGKLQTYDSTITALLTRSINLPKESIMEVEKFINENKHLGYITKEEFIKEAIRFKLKMLKDEYEYIEIPREKCKKLNAAVKEMNSPYCNTKDFVNVQIAKAIKKYENGRDRKKR